MILRRRGQIVLYVSQLVSQNGPYVLFSWFERLRAICFRVWGFRGEKLVIVCMPLRYVIWCHCLHSSPILFINLCTLCWVLLPRSLFLMPCGTVKLAASEHIRLPCLCKFNRTVFFFRLFYIKLAMSVETLLWKKG